MADRYDEDQQDVVVDFVDDSVIAGADTPLAIAADELLGALGSRVIRQQLNGTLNPAPSREVQFAKLTHS